MTADHEQVENDRYPLMLSPFGASGKLSYTLSRHVLYKALAIMSQLLVGVAFNL